LITNLYDFDLFYPRPRAQGHNIAINGWHPLYLKAFLEKQRHTLLPLSKYSPDFTPIEKSFGLIK